MPSVKNRALLNTLHINRGELGDTVIALEKAVVFLRGIIEKNEPMPTTTAREVVYELETARRSINIVRSREFELSEILGDFGRPINIEEDSTAA